MVNLLSCADEATPPAARNLAGGAGLALQLDVREDLVEVLVLAELLRRDHVLEEERFRGEQLVSD